jgi:hypothetical protein
MQVSIGLITSEKFLLACGVFASALKIAADILTGRRWKGYSFVHQSISELSAIGAPTRSLVVPLDVAYDALMIAFAAAVWRLAGDNSLMQITAALISANVLISLFVILFLPMRIAQDGRPTASTVHVVLMATGMVFFLLAIGLAGAAHNDWFRLYSYGTLLAYLALALGRFLVPSRSTSGSPRPTIGAQERTMVLGYLLWVVALAIHEVPKVST